MNAELGNPVPIQFLVPSAAGVAVAEIARRKKQNQNQIKRYRDECDPAAEQRMQARERPGDECRRR